MSEYAVGSRQPVDSAVAVERSHAPGFVVLGLAFAALGVAVWTAPVVSSASSPSSPGHALPAASLALRASAFAALAAAAFAGAATLRARYGHLAPWWVGLCVFGTATWSMVLWQPLPIFALASVVLGFVVVLFERMTPRTPAAEGGAPELYGGDGAEVVRRTAPRWLLAGALLGAPAIWHPAFLLLPIAVLGARPLHARRRAGLCLGAGMVAVLAIGILGSGSWERWSADLHLPLVDARLWGWNLIWSLVGRQTGGLVYFLPPFVLVLFAVLQERFTRSMMLGTFLTLVALIVLRPFDWVLGPTQLAAPAFLPLVGAGWFMPARRISGAGLVALAVLAGGALWPLYRAPLTAPVGADGAARYVAPWLHRLPVEVSQRELPGVREGQNGALRLRLLDGAISKDAVGALHLAGDRAADLVVISANPVPVFDVEFGARATPKLVVRGATMGETAFRPDGRVGFELRPEGDPLELPLWWSSTRQSIYRFSFRFEGAPAAPIAFTIAPGGVRPKPP